MKLKKELELWREFGRRFEKVRELPVGTAMEDVLLELVELADWGDEQGLLSIKNPIH